MWRYKLLLLVLFIPLALYTLWQSIRASEIRYFLQRLALFYNGKAKKDGIWIHAASVGEVNAVIPLILKIHEETPELTITLTSNTHTSASVVKKQLPESIQYFYFPLDYTWAVKRLIKKLTPKSIFIVETEFWPNLYTQAHKQNIPIVIINGRISEKTLYAKKWLKNIYAEILPLVTHVYARSETDQNRFIELGLSKNKIETLGNIKFALPEQQNIKPINFNRPYVLAASTREEEEQLIVDAWLKSNYKDELLVIVPRHPKRLSDILNRLSSFQLKIAVRSKKDKITSKTNVYIADTIGELKQFIAGSEFVIMGGSFVPKGGHNILEVAQLEKAVIFGPDMRSFEDEASLFLKYKNGIQCENTNLTSQLNMLHDDESIIKALEQNSKTLILDNENIFTHYLTLIRKHTC